jgi:hypothetical protein
VRSYSIVRFYQPGDRLRYTHHDDRVVVARLAGPRLERGVEELPGHLVGGAANRKRDRRA